MLKLLLDSYVGELLGEAWDFLAMDGAGHVVLRTLKRHCPPPQPQDVAPAEQQHRPEEFRPEKARPSCKLETVAPHSPTEGPGVSALELCECLSPVQTVQVEDRAFSSQ